MATRSSRWGRLGSTCDFIREICDAKRKSFDAKRVVRRIFRELAYSIGLDETWAAENFFGAKVGTVRFGNRPKFLQQV